MPRAKRLALPDAPGVYRFLDASGHLLYVGKATSLRRRVNSYFQKQSGVSERALELLTQARDLDVTEVATPLEAALLETDEIKRHAPPYNRALVVDRRDVWFCDAAFGGFASRASLRRPLGPFGGRSLPRGFAALLRIVAAPHAPQPGDIAAALPGRSLEGLPEAACAAEGVQRFIATLATISDDRLDAAGLLRLGHVTWPQLMEAQRATDHDDDEPDAPVAEDAPQWDPQRVADALVELCARFAHGLRRARWLVRLSESTIVFSEPPPSMVVRRILHVRGGQIVQRGHLPPDDALPIPPGWRETHRSRRRAFDLLTHDRLRVLTSELRRVASAGQEVRVRFGPAPELGDGRLRRVFAWI